MLIVDKPFPPYSPRDYVDGGMPDVADADELWSDEPEKGLGDARIEKRDRPDRRFTTWLVDGYQSRTDGKAAYVSE